MIIFSQFKKLVEPLQMWLLSNGRCVGCGKELLKVGKQKNKKNQKVLIICECQRAYIYQKNNKEFRRALNKELK